MANASEDQRSSLPSSILRGSVGLASVSLAVFAVWAYAGRWLALRFREAGFYAVEAGVFLILSGLTLYPLVRGPRPYRRFLRAFVPSFLAYSIVWCASWFALGFGPGEWLASLGGSIAFAGVAGLILGNRKAFPRAAAALFAGHSAGYFLGGPLHYRSGPDLRVLGILGWGLLYGLGFGAGIGYAFHALQKPRSPESSQASLDRND